MGFGLIIAGFVFLFNPTIHIFDIIPDFIGFYLIYKGLSKLSLLNGKLSTARDLFLRISGIELVKFLSLAFVFSSQSNVNNVGDMSKLLLTFVFAVLDYICFVPAVTNLFDGIDYLGIKYSSGSANAVLKRIRLTTAGGKLRFVKSERDFSTKVRNVIIAFYTFRLICSVIPELPALQNFERLGEVKDNAINFTEFKPLFYMFFGTIVLIFGAVFIYNCVKYFGSILKDTDFQNSLSAKYEKLISNNPNYPVGKNMKFILLSFACASVASFKLYIGGVNIIPAFVCSAIIIAAAVNLKNYVKFSVFAIITAIPLSVVAVVNIFLQYDYYRVCGFTKEDIFYLEQTVDKYNLLSAMMAVENILSLIMFCIVTAALYKTIKAHIPLSGTVYSENAQYKIDEFHKEIKAAVKKRFVILTVLMSANFVMGGLFGFITPYVPSLFSLNSLITIIWITSVISTVSYINSSMYSPMIEIKADY